MLIRPYDAGSEEEWRAILRAQDFGQLVAPGRERELPVVVPTHFALDGERTLLMHFARDNPVWAALAERPRALFTVIADYVYVPSDVNADDPSQPEWGVPTSYYATVQAECDVEVVDEPVALAALLQRQMEHFQPEGGHEPVEAGDNPYGRQLRAIRGVRLTITHARAKLKYGGNRTREHRLKVAEALAARGGPLDAAAREHLLRRTGVQGPP